MKYLAPLQFSFSKRKLVFFLAYSCEYKLHVFWKEWMALSLKSEFYKSSSCSGRNPSHENHDLPLKVKVLITQLCSTLCNPMDHSPAGSSVQGILQASIVEWVAIPFSGASSQPRDRTLISCIADGFLTTEPPGKPKFSLAKP